MKYWIVETPEGYIRSIAVFRYKEDGATSREVEFDGPFPEQFRDALGRYCVRWTGTEFETVDLPTTDEQKFSQDNVQKSILAIALILEAHIKGETLPVKAVEYMQKVIAYVKETL